MKTPDLKPCPFCGRPVGITETFIGTPYSSHATLCHDVSSKIKCPCGLNFEKEWTEVWRSGGVYTQYPNCEDITTAWNRRANDAGRKDC